MIKNRWLPVDRWMANPALGRFAKFAKALTVFIIFGVALLASAARLGFTNRFGMTLVALHFIVSLAQIKFGPLVMVEILLFKRLKRRRVAKLAAGLSE